MRIYIPTRSRISTPMQKTWDSLPQKLRDKANMVVNYDERDCMLPNLLVAPKSVKNIGDVRTFIYEYHRKAYPADPYFCMLDDDLRFFMRREDDNEKFIAATDQQKIDIFRDIESKLKEGYAQVSMLAREGANRITDRYLINYRPLRVYAYDARMIDAHGVQFDQCGTMDDFDVTLQLLEAGEENCVLAYCIHNQPGSNTPGGAACYRTLESHAESARTLKKRHPEFVTLVQKSTVSPGAWGAQERTDVRIAWKQAAKKGKNRG